MLSKAQIKHIQSLQRNKLRLQHQQYVAEGTKIVLDLLQSKQNVLHIYALDSWINEHINSINLQGPHIHSIDNQEIKSISSLQTPPQVIAVVQMPESQKVDKLDAKKLYLALDTIQDPGNMGTLLRTADWFGVDTIFCSIGCVDIYNSKVVQATMGSIARVNVQQTDIAELIQNNPQVASIAAVMDGENLYQHSWQAGSMILIGNEGNGLAENLIELASNKINIPQFGKAESLNAAIAAGVILSSYRAKFG